MGWDGLPAVEKPLDSGEAVGTGVAASVTAKLARGSVGCAQPAAGGEPTARSLRYAAPRFGAAVAALDLGTNNCRLLVARPAGGGFRVVDAFSRIVRLGEGLAATGALSEEAIARTLDALQICADKIAFRRIASRPLRRHRSVPARRQLRRISGARARRDRARDRDHLDRRRRPGSSFPAVPRCSIRASLMPIVFDIGGGSTEIVLVRLERRSRPPPTAPAHPRLDVVAAWRRDLDRPLWRRGFAGDLPHDGRGGGRRRSPPLNAAIAFGAISAPAGCRCWAARAR